MLNLLDVTRGKPLRLVEVGGFYSTKSSTVSTGAISPRGKGFSECEKAGLRKKSLKGQTAVGAAVVGCLGIFATTNTSTMSYQIFRGSFPIRSRACRIFLVEIKRQCVDSQETQTDAGSGFGKRSVLNGQTKQPIKGFLPLSLSPSKGQNLSTSEWLSQVAENLVPHNEGPEPFYLLLNHLQWCFNPSNSCSVRSVLA